MEQIIDGKSKYPLNDDGCPRRKATECAWGDYVDVEDCEDQMYGTEFETELYFLRLYDEIGHAIEGTSYDPALEEYVFDREERTVDGVNVEYFRRISLEWLQALIAERRAGSEDELKTLP